MRFERLSEQNVEKYMEYLMEAFTLEPDRMIADSLDAEGIRERVRDPFYLNTTSILAVVDDKVVGRIEYHFYGCMQDGYRMAYIDWIYVLPGYRHRGIAQSLFIEMERDCRNRDIDQYYLIRATNPEADKFYKGFEHAELSEMPFLRKELKTD